MSVYPLELAALYLAMLLDAVNGGGTAESTQASVSK